MQAFNPYLPSYEYVPDGEPRLFGERVYIYGSHDAFDGPNFCVNDYVCWSAPADDLADWRYEGVIYRKDQDPKNPDGKKTMCAPDVVQGPDGRYYLYYEFSDLTVTSVAVCDTPAGQYEFYGYVQRKDGSLYGEKKGEVNLFDPGVLVDDDGKIYFYTGFSPLPGFLKTIMGLRGLKLDGSYCIELEQDMITMAAEPKFLVPGPDKSKGTPFEGHSFFEASSIRKIGDTYYYVYSSELSHELCYATSKYPDKDFKYGGTLVSIGDIGYKGRREPVNYTENTHGGMVEVNGQWYIFYHRQTNKQKCCRQGCAEKIYINKDGSIDQAQMTSCGLNNGPLAGKGTYEARIACNLTSAQGTFPYLKVREKDKKQLHPYFTQSGADRECDPDQYIANLRNGACAGFKYFSMEGLDSVTVSVRGTGTGKVEVRSKRGADPIAVIDVAPAGSWTEFSAPATAEVTGTKPLYFTYTGDGSIDFSSFTLA